MKASVMVLAAAAAGFAALAGCESGWNVKRVDPAKSTDLTYRFNDQDARQIFQSMSKNMLSAAWLDRWIQEHGGKRPIVYLATVKNNTDEYVNTALFTNQLQDEMINSGRIDVKLERTGRQEIRDERLDTKYNDPATIKAAAKELNADLALMGSVEQSKQMAENGRTVVNYYQARMELVNVETAQVVFSKTEEIKKVATR